MTKAEKAAAATKSQEMKSWSKPQWAAFNRTYSAQETIVSLHEIDREAYKGYMVSCGLSTTEAAGGHYAILSTKTGAMRLDQKALFAELRELGVNIDALVEKHTHKTPDVKAFSFK